MAVYTKVPEDELKKILSKYDIGDTVFFKGIAEGVENSNYLLQTSRDNFIFTIYEKRVNTDDLPYFLELMNHLSQKGIACPTPIANKKGEYLGKIEGKPFAITSFLKGLSCRKIRLEHCADLGRKMAEMHVAGLDFGMSRPNSLSVDSWRPLFELSANRANEIRDGLAEEIDRELSSIEKEWPDDLPKGVIHADMFPDNVFFLDNKCSGIIDFYFACNDFLAYEIAVCLNAWCFEDGTSFNTTKARRILANYNKVRKLSDEEIRHIPTLARGSAMRFLLTRLYDWLNTPQDALVKPKDPLEYLTKLRFHKGVSTSGSYGIY